MTAPPLTPMDHVGRLERLRAAMAAELIDALLVTDAVSRRYLTGFTGSAGLLMVTADRLRFVTDGRYGDQAAEQLQAGGVDAELEVTGNEQRAAVVALAEGLACVGLEADSVTWAAQRRYATDWFPEHEVVPTSGLVAGLRAVKEPGEVDRIEAAAAIADAALAALSAQLADGPTEAEFGLALDTEMRRRGAAGPSFETIVAAGPNGARPHARPTDRPIMAGDLVVVDFGAVVDGYCSDMTRTFAIGDVSATARRMVDVVTAAQAAGVGAVAAGVSGRAVDAACRTVIDEAGWGEAFLHGTGHGVGLEIHEDPRVSSASTGTLAAGHIVTVEPGVYLAEHGGVRIEDTVVVTDDGCRALTRAPKSPDPQAATPR